MVNRLEHKLIGLAVDGAPTMLSDQNGQLKVKMPKLIANHCPIHRRIVLAVKSLGQYKKPKDINSLTEEQKEELIMKIGVSHSLEIQINDSRY